MLQVGTATRATAPEMGISALRRAERPRWGGAEFGAGAGIGKGETTHSTTATARCSGSVVRAGGGTGGSEQEREVSELQLEDGLTLSPCVT